MKANNLTISIPTPECNRCEYCVSKMTFLPQIDECEFKKNFPKIIAIAERNAIDTVLITGKGEPLEAGTNLWTLVSMLEKKFIVELQTNIKYIQKNIGSLQIPGGIDILAISVDDPKQLCDNENILKDLSNTFTLRITINVTKEFSEKSLWLVLDLCKLVNAKQVTFRQLTIPINTPVPNVQAQYIATNNADDIYYQYTKSIEKLKLRGKLNFGPNKYYFEGMSVIFMDYCVQDNNNGKDRRSLIYQADGHLYDSWNFEESIIF